MLALKSRSLLLIPLLCAGCATAMQPATPLANPDAPEVRFGRVTPYSVHLELPEPVHASVLYVRPSDSEIARWAASDVGTRRLAAGSRRLKVGGSSGLPTARTRARTMAAIGRPCSQARERLVWHVPGDNTGYSGGQLRGVFSGATQASCSNRGPSAEYVAPREQGMFLVVSREPLDEARIAEVVGEFNSDYAGAELDAATLARHLSERLAAAIPGVGAYYTALPAY
jgi:hypothetical protein